MVQNKIRELSDREHQLLKQGLHFSEIFPLVANGRISYKRMRGYCNVCRDPIPDENTFAAKTNPVNGVTVVEGVGVCHRCRVCTPFFLRFHEQGYIDGPSPIDGRWSTWKFDGNESGSRKWWDIIAWSKYLLRFGR